MTKQTNNPYVSFANLGRGGEPLGWNAEFSVSSVPPWCKSPLLVDDDDEVAFSDVVARDAQFLHRVELAEHQDVALPADEFLVSRSLVLLVDDAVDPAAPCLLCIRHRRARGSPA